MKKRHKTNGYFFRKPIFLFFFLFLSLFQKTFGEGDSSPSYSELIRSHHPLVYAKFEESEEDDQFEVETPFGLMYGRFSRTLHQVMRGHPSAFPSLGKAYLFRRGPRTEAKISLEDTEQLGLDFSSDQSFTIEAWICPREAGPYKEVIVSLDPPGGYRGYSFSLEPDASLKFSRRASQGIKTAPGLIQSGKWTHVAVVIKGASGMIYINGEEAFDRWSSLAPMNPGARACFRIGSSHPWDGDYSFDGYIDEVAVYDSALEKAQLQTHIDTAKSSTKNSLHLSFGNEFFLKRGLQCCAWVLHGKNLDPHLWKQSHFSLPIFYSRRFSEGIFETVATGPWGYLAPRKPLHEDEELLRLTPEQLSRLSLIQYGDEQDLTDPQNLEEVSAYFKSVRAQFPQVLLHTNQYGPQLNERQLREVMLKTRPDLLTYDTYFFDSKYAYPGGSLLPMYNWLGKYRSVALRGTEDDFRSPLPFGHYLQGFLMKGSKMSQSQVNAQIFGAWTFGAKWVCLFWYNFLDDNGLSYLFDQWPDGPTRPGYDFFAEAVRESQVLSPALSQLQTTDVYFIPGWCRKSNGQFVKNALPRFGTLHWSSHSIPFLANVKVRNLGSFNYGLPGDVVIGLFRPLIDEEREEGLYFMVFNGLTDYDGNGEQTAQEIELEFDFSELDFHALLRVNRKTEDVEVLCPESLGEDKFRFRVRLEGGKADLFKLLTEAPFLGK